MRKRIISPSIVTAFLFYLAVCWNLSCSSSSDTSTACQTNCDIQTLAAGPLSYEINEEPAIGKYAIHFIVAQPQFAEYHLVRVDGITVSRAEALVHHFRTGETDWTMNSLASNTSIEFEVRKLEVGVDESVVQTLKISLPRDVVISGLSLASALNLKDVARLNLKSDAVISALDKDLKISAKKLFAEPGAKIETFPLNATAGENKNGRSGGKIEINADEATGEIEVNLRGEDSGKWTITPTPLVGENYRGPIGASGSEGQSECKFAIYLPIPDVPVRCYCNTAPGNGGQGGAGPTGLAGFAGLSGGDSGSLSVNLKQAPNFRVVQHRVSGRGSDGSLGGVGGLGGHGGQPGHVKMVGIWQIPICPDASIGADGPLGARGPKGPPGSNGKDGTVCLKLSESSGIYCL